MVYLLAGTKIDGITIAQSIKDKVKQDVVRLSAKGITPCLATILVGDDAASATYVRNKHNACAKVGINTQDHKLDADTTQLILEKLVSDLNGDDTVHGILVQLPLPSHLDDTITTKISPLKDVDGLTPYNMGLLAMQKAVLVACTPSGVMEIFNYHNIPLQGKHAVIINRSTLVGKPLHHLLLEKNATVTMCHSKTLNLKEICQSADIIITAVGNRSLFTLTSDMIKEGAVIIDVAILRHNEKLTGDVDFDNVINKASFVTPVPGGVGPMTVAMLLKNTVTAASMSSHLD